MVGKRDLFSVSAMLNMFEKQVQSIKVEVWNTGEDLKDWKRKVYYRINLSYLISPYINTEWSGCAVYNQKIVMRTSP